MAQRLGDDVKFGEFGIGATKISTISHSALTVVFQDLKPITPGHVVVAPRRPVERLSQLGDDELGDFISTTRTVQNSIEAHYSDVAACNLALKDGSKAGGPVRHLHLHIVPRRPGDFAENDEVYTRIDKWSPAPAAVNAPPPLDLPADEARKPRTEQVMAEESLRYRDVAKDIFDAATIGVIPVEFNFSRFELKQSQLFFASTSGLSVAFVNLKPLVPGHVLVSPARCVARHAELSEEESLDLWQTVRKVQRIVGYAHAASDFNLGMQDGIIAGQTVPHVHVHILPIK